MYLSRVRINPTRVKTRQLVGSPQITHALVEGSRPPGGEHHSGRALWRLDRHGSDLELFVASPWRPDFTGLVEQTGWPSAPTWDTRDYSPLLRSLVEGQRWTFRVTVNPTHSVAQGQGRRGKVAPHRTAAHQTCWFVERALGWGFEVATNSLPDAPLELELVERNLVSFRRRAGDGDGDSSRGGRVSLTLATFVGALRVVDVERFGQALSMGLGRAKGYGCGLMTLAPPR